MPLHEFIYRGFIAIVIVAGVITSTLLYVDLNANCNDQCQEALIREEL